MPAAWKMQVDMFGQNRGVLVRPTPTVRRFLRSEEPVLTAPSVLDVSSPPLERAEILLFFHTPFMLEVASPAVDAARLPRIMLPEAIGSTSAPIELSVIRRRFDLGDQIEDLWPLAVKRASEDPARPGLLLALKTLKKFQQR